MTRRYWIPPPPSHSKLWINIIRHRPTRNTELTTLQLYKSFTFEIKQIDPNLIILPIDSTKKNFTSITSVKQIEKLSTNQLRLYFKSWFNEQHCSLIGLIHLGTILSFDEICQHPNIMEWLSVSQYSLKMYKSVPNWWLMMVVFSYTGKICCYALWNIHRGLL